jgi:hypothetical protein
VTRSHWFPLTFARVHFKTPPPRTQLCRCRLPATAGAGDCCRAPCFTGTSNQTTCCSGCRSVGSPRQTCSQCGLVKCYPPPPPPPPLPFPTRSLPQDGHNRDIGARLGDFGLSKLYRDGPDNAGNHTMATHQSGTPGYIPPESAQGIVPANGLSDVYSFGVTLLQVRLCLGGVSCSLVYKGQALR